jgi:hypothetical protein
MDKKIILVLLILLVLAIYYCYTHESFTENFKSVADIVKGGVIEFFESSANNGNITGDLNVSGNTKLGTWRDKGAINILNGTASPDSAKIQWGDGTGWRVRFQKDDKNPVMDVIDTGSVAINKDLTVSGRNILGEIDALKGGNANKIGTDTTKAIEDLGKIAAQLLAGGATVPGNLTINGTTTIAGGLTIKNGTASPDAHKIQWGDGSGWRLRYQKDDKNPVMDVIDNGTVSIQKQLYVGGRDILDELNAIKGSIAALKSSTVKWNDDVSFQDFDNGWLSAGGRVGSDNNWRWHRIRSR